MGIIDKLEKFSNSGIDFISDYSKWFYFGGSFLVFCMFVIPGIISSKLTFLFVVTMIFASLCIGWPMMLIYMLPFGFLQLFCYCVRNPIEALGIFIKIILSCIALFLLAMCIHIL